MRDQFYMDRERLPSQFPIYNCVKKSSAFITVYSLLFLEYVAGKTHVAAAAAVIKRHKMQGKRWTFTVINQSSLFLLDFEGRKEEKHKISPATTTGT